MKRYLITTVAAISAMVLLSGCIFIAGGNMPGSNSNATLGQQLTDLQKAKDSGAITDAEFQVQKAKLLKNCK